MTGQSTICGREPYDSENCFSEGTPFTKVAQWLEATIESEGGQPKSPTHCVEVSSQVNMTLPQKRSRNQSDVQLDSRETSDLSLGTPKTSVQSEQEPDPHGGSTMVPTQPPVCEEILVKGIASSPKAPDHPKAAMLRYAAGKLLLETLRDTEQVEEEGRRFDTELKGLLQAFHADQEQIRESEDVSDGLANSTDGANQGFDLSAGCDMEDLYGQEDQMTDFPGDLEAVKLLEDMQKVLGLIEQGLGSEVRQNVENSKSLAAALKRAMKVLQKRPWEQEGCRLTLDIIMQQACKDDPSNALLAQALEERGLAMVPQDPASKRSYDPLSSRQRPHSEFSAGMNESNDHTVKREAYRQLVNYTGSVGDEMGLVEVAEEIKCYRKDLGM